MTRFAFVVCGNGFGHLRRVANVIQELVKLSNDCKILIVGTTSHMATLLVGKFWTIVDKQQVSFVATDLQDNLRSTLPDGYSIKDYHRSWGSTFQVLKDFKPSKIISDNLAGVLQEYPEAILMGSFIWSDCLTFKYPGVTEIAEICKFELDLLNQVRPAMYGLNDMVMPEVRNLTTFHGLPWFCSRTGSADVSGRLPKRLPCVLVTGGGTGLGTKQLEIIVESLIAEGKVVLFVDRTLFSICSTDHREVLLFDFEPESFEILDLIICRPGLGILTDAVKHLIPVCAVADHDKEILFNANRIEELGMGVSLEENSRFRTEDFLSLPLQSQKECIRSLKVGGSAEMAMKLIEH